MLSSAIRPTSLEDLIGQSHLIHPHHGLITNFLRLGYLPSMLLIGPPGVGKTTLAYILARKCGYEFEEFSATNATLSDIRELVLRIQEKNRRLTQSYTRVVVFIDEFHRFSKTQQDYLLPFVEAGHFVLIGATTEAKRVRSAISSRCHTFHLLPHTPEDIAKVVRRAVAYETSRLDKRLEFPPKCVDLIVNAVGGDTRKAVGLVELLCSADEVTEELVRNTIHSLRLPQKRLQYEENVPLFHRFLDSLWERGVPDDDIFVDAFKMAQFEDEKVQHLQVSDDEEGFSDIQPMEDGSVSPAIFWLLRLLAAGESPLYIAQRLVVFACLHMSDESVNRILSQVQVIRQTDKAEEVLYRCVEWVAQQEKHPSRIPEQLMEMKAYTVKGGGKAEVEVDYSEEALKCIEEEHVRREEAVDVDVVYEDEKSEEQLLINININN